MRRRALLRTVACLAVVLSVAAGAFAYLVRREPTCYRGITVPEGSERRKLAGDFSSNVQRLVDTIGSNTDDRWSETFTADQMNSYFAEDFVRVRPFKLPDEIHSPRVSIQPGRMCLAFRYGHGFWSTVVTVELNVWLAANEPNVIAVELLGLHAGSVPFSMPALLEHIDETARQSNVEVNWYRHEGRPVALVRLQPDRPNPSVILQRLELREGLIVVEGRSTEPVPIRTMLSMNDRVHP